MKRLVAYYSRTGITKRIGEELAEALEADSEEIVDQKSRKGRIGWLKAGMDATLQKMTEIKVQKTPKDYDVIIVGTPIWNGRVTPAIRTYLQSHDFTKRKIAFFTTQGGDEAEDALAEMKKMVADSDIIGVLSIRQDDVKSNSYTPRLQAFIEHLKQ